MKTVKKKRKINGEPAQPPYMRAAECAKICCFKGSEAIRRAVARGELPGVHVQKNRLLIPTKEFWEWFHRNDPAPVSNND